MAFGKNPELDMQEIRSWPHLGMPETGCQILL